MGDGFLAAPPHASRRLKILVASHWCCKVIPATGYPAEEYPGKLLFSTNWGLKMKGVGFVRPETKTEVRNEDWPQGAYLSGLILVQDIVVVISTVAPFSPSGVGSRDPGR